MNVDDYLERIAYDGPRQPSRDALHELHRAHLLAVPFENLDIALGRRFDLSLPAVFRKIVDRRRGGFCYELNGLFGWLLQELGFERELLSARVFQDGTPGPEFDHMLLRVEAGGSMLADVGFGDSFIDPIPLTEGDVEQGDRVYRLGRDADDWVLAQRLPGAGFEPQLLFSPIPRRLDDFGPMCVYQQTSPASSFTRKSLCTRATPNGRWTLSNARFIVTQDGRRDEQDVDTAEVYRALLHERFGIELAADADVQRLMQPRPPSSSS